MSGSNSWRLPALALGAGALGFLGGRFTGDSTSRVEAAERGPDRAAAAAPASGPAALQGAPDAPAAATPETAASPAPTRASVQEQQAEALAAETEVGVSEALLQELDDYLATGKLRASLVQSDMVLGRFLLSRYRTEDRQEDVDALLETLQDPGLWSEEGQRWRSGKNRDAARASQAFTRSLDLALAAGGDSLYSQSRRTIDHLSRLDLAAAADYALAVRNASPDVGPEQDFQLGTYLARAGREEEAAELMRAHVQDPFEGLAALEELIQLAPESALEEIRRRAALDDDEGASNTLLARALAASGDTEGAIAHIEDLLRAGEDVVGLDRGVASLVQHGDPEQWLDRLPIWADQLTTGPDSWELSDALYSKLDALMDEEDGDPAQAEQLLGHIFDERVSNILSLDYLPEIPESLREPYRPQIVATLRNMEVRAAGDDEAWGDIGDRYFELGNVEDARRAWTRALAIDPQDGEWSGNLRSLSAGTLER